MRRPWTALGCCATGKKLRNKYKRIFIYIHTSCIPYFHRIQLIIRFTNEIAFTVYSSKNYCASLALMTGPTLFCVYSLKLLTCHVTVTHSLHSYIFLSKNTSWDYLLSNVWSTYVITLSHFYATGCRCTDIPVPVVSVLPCSGSKLNCPYNCQELKYNKNLLLQYQSPQNRSRANSRHNKQTSDVPTAACGL